jgi:hypothetical protein
MRFNLNQMATAATVTAGRPSETIGAVQSAIVVIIVGTHAVRSDIIIAIAPGVTGAGAHHLAPLSARDLAVTSPLISPD